MSLEKTNEKSSNAVVDTTKVMLLTLASTTIRIFGPVTLLFLLGLAYDKLFDVRLIGIIVGTTLGIIIAALLVAQQLKTIKKETITNGN